MWWMQRPRPRQNRSTPETASIIALQSGANLNVVGVALNSPAKAAGLRVGDIIVEVDGAAPD